MDIGSEEPVPGRSGFARHRCSSDEYDSTRAKNRFCVKASSFDASGLFFPQALPPNMPQRPGTSSTGRGNDLRNGTDEPPCRPKVWPSYHGGVKRKVASDSPFEDLGDKYVKRYAGSILRKRPESSELRFLTFEAPGKDAIRKHEAFFISAGNARKAPSSFLFLHSP